MRRGGLSSSRRTILLARDMHTALDGDWDVQVYEERSGT